MILTSLLYSALSFLGFYDLVPQYLIKMYDERELELVIFGLGKIDITDWRENTALKHCTKGRQNISAKTWAKGRENISSIQIRVIHPQAGRLTGHSSK